MYYFYDRDKDNEQVAETRQYRQRLEAIPVHELAA